MYEKHLAELAHRRFYQHPETEPHAIAKHYAAHALLALRLLDYIDAREEAYWSGGDVRTFDDAILHAVQLIKTNHLADFGIQLEWHPNSENNKR